MLLSKGKQRDNVNKAKPPPTFSCWCRNLKSRKTVYRGEQNQLADVAGNSMEQKSYNFLPQLRSRIHPPDEIVAFYLSR